MHTKRARSRAPGAARSAGKRTARIGIGEIARRAGVAPSTVSYALSGNRSISERTRARILEVIEASGYRPNLSARALKEGRSRTVGLVIPPPSHGLLDTQLALVGALSELCSTAHLDLLLSPSRGEHDQSFERMLTGQRVDGVLVTEVRMRDERIPALERSGVPYVLIGRPADPRGLFWADFDYAGLIERCVDQLADLGHRSIALLNRPAPLLASGYGPAHRAVEAFESACARRGLRAHALSCPDDAAGGEGAINEILGTRPRITAAVTINDGALAGVSRALDRAHVQLPRDFSLMGIVGRRWAEDFHPPLTGAVFSAEALVRTAFEILMQRIADPALKPFHKLIAAPITQRATAGQAPAAPAGVRARPS